MFYTIYKTTNLINGKVYVGKHKTDHLDDEYIGSGKLLRLAIQKYGRENFYKEILFILESEEGMDAKEAEIVTEEFCSRSDTYNISPGGKGGWGYVNCNRDPSSWRDVAIATNKKRQDTISKRRAAGYKRKFPASIKEHFRKNWGRKGETAQFYGKTHTEATKQRIREKASLRTGSKNSQFGTRWITNGSETRKIKSIDSLPVGWAYGRTL